SDRRKEVALSLDPKLELFTVRTHRSEEHTSELQSHSDLVCRLLLEKKTFIEYRSAVRNLQICALSIDFVFSLLGRGEGPVSFSEFDNAQEANRFMIGFFYGPGAPQQCLPFSNPDFPAD